MKMSVVNKVRRAPHSRTERTFEKRAPAGLLLGRTDFPALSGGFWLFFCFQFTAILHCFYMPKLLCFISKLVLVFRSVHYNDFYIYQIFRLYYVGYRIYNSSCAVPTDSLFSRWELDWCWWPPLNKYRLIGWWHILLLVFSTLGLRDAWWVIRKSIDKLIFLWVC